MKFKKFIPLTLAAMSVMGAFTACSDNQPKNNVVGADEQPNSVAETTISIDPVFANDAHRVLAARLNEVAKPNAPTSAILAHDSTMRLSIIKTFDGDSIYNNEKNRIINMNYLDTTIIENKGWSYYSMQDENGVLHGPIAMAQFGSGFNPDAGYSNNVACVNENKRLIVGDEVHNSSEYYDFSVGFGNVQMVLQTNDSLLIAQFKEDCNAENGKSFPNESTYSAFGDLYVDSKWYCVMQRDDPYKDPLWEKYASYIIDNCRSDIVSD